MDRKREGLHLPGLEQIALVNRAAERGRGDPEGVAHDAALSARRSSASGERLRAAASGLWAVPTRARCVNAWGKFPTMRPRSTSYSSLSSPKIRREPDALRGEHGSRQAGHSEDDAGEADGGERACEHGRRVALHPSAHRLKHALAASAGQGPRRQDPNERQDEHEAV